MLRQIEKVNIGSRLADESLFLFRIVDVPDAEAYAVRFDAYPIRKFGTPEEILKALDSENYLLFEECEEQAGQLPKFSLI